MKTNSLHIILPVLNEEGNLAPLVKKLIKLVSPNRIFVIDDNSTDNTINVVKKLRKQHTQVKLIVNKIPLGLTASIQKGIDSSSSALVAWMDADFSHPPETLRKMLLKIQTYDIVIGSWLVRGGSDNRNEKTVKIISFLINKLCNILFFPGITAYTSGFILCRRKVIQKIRLQGDYGEYCIDLLVRSVKLNFTTVEVPFICKSRKVGISKTSPNPAVYIRKGLKYLKLVISLLIFG